MLDQGCRSPKSTIIEIRRQDPFSVAPVTGRINGLCTGEMMTNYPIISQRAVPKASRRGPMGLVPPRRAASELPLPNAHEAVVYKAAGSYVVDDGRSRATDGHIVNATNITVVDMREDAPITVQATIPSAGAAEFTVHVTFLCTVKKPEEVVEAGLHDLTTALTHYLIQHQKLFHLGEDYQLGQVAAVRHDVTAQVKAYFNVRPARFRGLDVRLGNVQVLTPDELRTKQRERELAGLLTSEQQQMEHDLAKQKAVLEETRRQHDEKFELERRRHDQALALMQQQLTHMEEQLQQQLQQQKLAHDQLIRTAPFRHAVDEATQLKDALGADDSAMPTIIAGAIGERTITETADSLNAERDRRQDQEAENAAQQREWEREKARYERQITREMQYNLEVERLKTQASVVVAAVNRGLADHQNVEFLMSELRSVAKQLEHASAEATEDMESASGVGTVSTADAEPSPQSVTSQEVHQRDASPGRYLLARCPEVVPIGKPFSLLANIVQTSAGISARLVSFDVPSDGQDVLLVLHAPGLRILGDQRVMIRVPAAGDSNPVMFELRADDEGPRSISITAWLGGSYLGELLVDITAGREHSDGQHREFGTEIDTKRTEGAVSLVVRYDPDLKSYRFEFRDEDNPSEVVSRLSFEPRHRIERLVAGLDRLAAGRSGYSAKQARDYLVNAGAELWSELVPPGLREQFWDRQSRIQQLTILADKDTVPWELLYPKEPGHDEGFLVEQFPVTRGIFGRRPVPRLSLWPARFVLPSGSLPEAMAEVDAMRRLLDPSQAPEAVISDLTPLQDLIRVGDFGLLHFACHNRFEADDDASIQLGGVQFTPRFMTTAVIDKVLARSAPIVFMNACRSAGLAPTYNRLDGWASRFLKAGAGAFIGSQWAVSDGTAREFAEEFYGQLKTGASLGEAMMGARARAATHADDPTWLAYSAYGDPRASATNC
jgi:multidrug efflux pump subunit AcrA (membrane-fusion protein)